MVQGPSTPQILRERRICCAQDDKGTGSRLSVFGSRLSALASRLSAFGFRLSALGKETPGYRVEAMRLKQ